MKKAYVNYLFAALLGLVAVPASFATTDAPAESAVYTEQTLEQLLAPIALYPDALLSQILMASTYPLEIVQAARWSRAHPGVQGEQAVQAVNDRGWDPSVKSMVAFPQILQMMDEKLDWTDKLGDAFLAQSSQVMDTVQALRQRAYAAGNLKSTDNYRVEQRDRIIVVESPRPEVVYVPYYDPYVVYGTWRWAAYPPVRWAPWPGYVHAGFVGFRWSVGISIGPRFFFGAFDWPHRHVAVVNVNTFYYPRPVHRTVVVHNTVWRHNPHHRHGVPYRHPTVQRQYVNAPQIRHDRVVTRPVVRDNRRDDHRVDRDHRSGQWDRARVTPHREDQSRTHRNTSVTPGRDQLRVSAPKAVSQPSSPPTKVVVDKRPDDARRAVSQNRQESMEARGRDNVRVESGARDRDHGGARPDMSRRNDGARFQAGVRAQRDTQRN